MWVLRPQELLCIQVWGPQALALDETLQNLQNAAREVSCLAEV